MWGEGPAEDPEPLRAPPRAGHAQVLRGIRGTGGRAHPEDTESLLPHPLPPSTPTPSDNLAPLGHSGAGLVDARCTPGMAAGPRTEASL